MNNNKSTEGGDDNRLRSTYRSIMHNAVASTMGASIVALLVTPLDVAKVRMQAYAFPVGGSLPCPDPAQPNGTIGMMRRIIRADGVRGLWSGLGPTLVLAVPTTGLYFTMYDCLRKNAELDPLHAGAVARVISATVASPLELARTQLQAGATGNVFQILKRAQGTNGTSALWRGLLPTLLRDVPFSAIYWSCYERLRDPNRCLFGEVNALTGGILAGSVAAFCTVPADVVKTRRQTVAKGATPQPLTQIVSQIARSEGIPGFFRGIVPRLAKIAPSSGVMMFSYSWILSMLSSEP